MRIAKRVMHTVKAIQLNPTRKIRKQDKWRSMKGITLIQSISLPEEMEAYFSSKKELSNQKNNFLNNLLMINLSVLSNVFYLHHSHLF